MTMRILLAMGLVMGVSAPAAIYADSANWSEAKKHQIEINREANAGKGNGGEFGGEKTPSESGKDLDPGNSGDHNQAGK
ncbi:hypothetical protein AB0T83_07810 [Fluviibacterium sp. DFM31]|uniref:Uncharacterized protein n=1 Tax=Meridianimarinicoccus marinus TaxID=3231483 RepID=A0ABV3L522_9RHOB